MQGSPLLRERGLSFTGTIIVAYMRILSSFQCQKWAWSKPKFPGQLPHRGLCAANKVSSATSILAYATTYFRLTTQRHMLRIPEAHAILTSFPWGRLESDYTFSFDLARGRFKVLGGSGMGYWSQRGGPVAHTNNGDAHDEYKKHQPQRLLKYNQEFKHVDGYDLLHRVGHLTDAQGWKLSPELIPYRDLDEIQDEQHPVLVTEFEGGVKDWDSWYRWRRLPKRSPAALLMNYPLSVYHLVVDMLRLTRPEKGKSDKRVRLCVHMIGAEVELNYLPLYVSFLSTTTICILTGVLLICSFSELALLLPYHDITLLLWGQSVHDLLAEAATRGAEGSPAWDALAKNGLIFSYAAPDKLGGGTIKIILSRVSPMWNAQSQKILSDAAPELTPDALVALNAGLGAYRSWMEVIHVAHLLDIPFAVTEYTEQSLEHVVREQVRSSLEGRQSTC